MDIPRGKAFARPQLEPRDGGGNRDSTLKRSSAFLTLAALVAVAGGSHALAQYGPQTGSPLQQMSARIDTAARKDVVEALANAMADSYASAELGQKMAHLLQSKLAAGAYDTLTNGEQLAGALTADIRSVVNDSHFNVAFNPQPPRIGPGGPPGGARSGPSGPLGGMRAMNGAIPQVKILAGNVGYMEVNGEPPLASAKDAIAAAFAFLRNTDALIIDGRANGGGDPETVAYYMSYLSEGAPYAVNRVHWRKGDRIDDIKTTDLGALSYGAKKPVFYLTSQTTRSAGEEFAYDVQAFKRGVIIGETTAGAANPGGFRPLGHGFSAFVPTGFVVHPITGGNWEGVGVKPDVAVPSDEAVAEAHRLAIERLLAVGADPQVQGALAALALALKVHSLDGSGPTTRPRGEGLGVADKSRQPQHFSTETAVLDHAQLAGRYSAGMGPEADLVVTERPQGLFLTTPRNPEVLLVPLGGDRYRLAGRPDDFVAFFSLNGNGKVQLLLDLSQPAPILAQKR